MFADTISSIVSDANEENIETWKERDAFMNNAMRRIMAKELQESNEEGRSEERILIKKATKVAKDNNISNVSDLEALGFDKDTAEGAISILTELGIISWSDIQIKYPHIISGNKNFRIIWGILYLLYISTNKLFI